MLSFYLSVESDGVTKFLRIVIPSKHENYIIGLWKRSQAKIGLWMQGQVVLAIIVAILVFLGLTLLRVPNALLLAVVAGLFEIIPLFGPVLAAIPAVIITLVSGGLTGSPGYRSLYHYSAIRKPTHLSIGRQKSARRAAHRIYPGSYHWR